MLQGVLFDMDGLMFDTERIGRDGWHKAAEILHIDLPEEIIAAMRGTGTDRCREIFNAAIPGSLYDTAHDCGCAMRTRSSPQTAYRSSRGCRGCCAG